MPIHTKFYNIHMHIHLHVYRHIYVDICKHRERQTFMAIQPYGYTPTWLHRYIAVWLIGYIALSYGYVTVWLRYMTTWLCVATYVAIWIYGCMALLLYGHNAIWQYDFFGSVWWCLTFPWPTDAHLSLSFLLSVLRLLLCLPSLHFSPFARHSTSSVCWGLEHVIQIDFFARALGSIMSGGSREAPGGVLE